MSPLVSWAGWLALGASALAAILLIAYLIVRPARAWLWLLLAIGVLPIGASFTANVNALEVSHRREFCGSCHIMTPYLHEAADRASVNLAALHSRNAEFGDSSCYSCHADYGMYGGVKTKLDGMRHMWTYCTRYRDAAPANRGGPKIHLVKPFDTSTQCMRCHSATLPQFEQEPSHSVVIASIRAKQTSCIAGGCHDSVHPAARGDVAPRKEASR